MLHRILGAHFGPIDEHEEKLAERLNENKSLSLQITSAGYHDGNLCKFSIQDKEIIGERGLNVVLINNVDGQIIEYAIYDTHLSAEEAEDFARMVDAIVPGTIVVLAIRDDGIEKLTEAARLACESIGSKCIRQAQYRDSWCIIGRKGAAIGSVPECLTKSKSGKAKLQVQNMELRNPSIDALMSSQSPLAYRAVKLPNNGRWLRRRKLDGALQRTPVGFYAKIYHILEKSKFGLNIRGKFLPRDPTISEKTPEEVNFALMVELWLNEINDAAERQLAVECLMILHEVGRRLPEVQLVNRLGKLDLMSLVDEASLTYYNIWKDENAKANSSLRTNSNATPEKSALFQTHNEQAKFLFYDLQRGGVHGTLSLLVRAAMKIIPYEVDFSITDVVSPLSERVSSDPLHPESIETGQHPVSAPDECRQM